MRSKADIGERCAWISIYDERSHRDLRLALVVKIRGMVRCDLGGGDRNWYASCVRPTAVRSHLPLQEAEEARRVFSLTVEWEAIMRFRTTGILSLSLCAMALDASAVAQTTPAPPAISRHSHEQKMRVAYLGKF